MSCTKILGKFCVALKIIALISQLVALGIPYWYKGDTTESTVLSETVKTTVREGLWKKCTDLVTPSNSNSFCEANEATTVILVIRWLLMVGSGILGIAILASGAAHLESNRTAFIVGAVHAFMTAVLNITSTALYATVIKDDIGFELKHLYIGWGLVFLAVGLLLIGGVTAMILARMVGGEKVENKKEVEGDISRSSTAW